MGVKSLYSLLKGNNQIYQDIHFRDSRLLVDGNNLVYHLYFTSNLDQNHGGEYLAFQAKVQAFFNILTKCEIKPYVVMDGGVGTSDLKIVTIKRWARGRVRSAHDAAMRGKKKNIIPTLAWSVFLQTLSIIKVSLAKFSDEANCHLAALAREWCCPVLSNDTDFYIFDLQAGVLPLVHFRLDSVETSRSGSYIPCKLYTTSSFCNFFTIDRQLLPAFALLAGNDYVNFKGIRWARFLLAGRQHETSWAAGLEGLLSWLSRFRTTEEAVTAAMNLEPDINSQLALRDVEIAMLKYQIPSSSLLEFFSDGTAPSLHTEMLSSVPNWTDPRCKVLMNHVERSDLPSSNIISLPIRQVFYGLLLGLGQGGVLEVVRVGLGLVKEMVQPVVKGAAQTLRLDSLPQADQAVRLQVCLETLGVTEEALNGVPAHLRLPVAVTCYWLRRARPNQTLLKALLMVMVQGELNRQKRSTCCKSSWLGDTDQMNQAPDSVVAHSFNQWQACLRDALKLNQLLCMPLPNPHLAWLFQGRLVHQRQKELQEETLKAHSVNFIRLYRGLLGAVLQPDLAGELEALRVI